MLNSTCVCTNSHLLKSRNLPINRSSAQRHLHSQRQISAQRPIPLLRQISRQRQEYRYLFSIRYLSSGRYLPADGFNWHRLSDHLARYIGRLFFSYMSAMTSISPFDPLNDSLAGPACGFSGKDTVTHESAQCNIQTGIFMLVI